MTELITHVPRQEIDRSTYEQVTTKLRGDSFEIPEGSEVLDSQATERFYGIPGRTIASIGVGAAEFAIIDIRDTANELGYLTVAEGVSLIPQNTPYILVGRGDIDPAKRHIDFIAGTGFKGLRPGEKISLGRNHIKSYMSHEGEELERDVTDRFADDLLYEYMGKKGENLSISSNHAEISLGLDGQLKINDLHSTNGTEVVTTKPNTISPNETGPTFETPEAASAGEPTLEIAPGVIEHRAKTKKAFEELRESVQATPSVEELLRKGVEPIEFVEAGNRPFFISRIMDEGSGRKLAVILYTETDSQKVVARLAYKSMSDGGWRIARAIEPLDEGTRYAKGLDRLYTQEGKPVDVIRSALENLEQDETAYDPVNDFDSISREFYDKTLTAQGVDTYAQEHRFLALDEATTQVLDKFRPGYLDETDDAGEYFAKLVIPEKYMPDFDKEPISVTEHEHSILGKVTFRTYGSRGFLNLKSEDGQSVEAQLQWTFASDKDGRVWIESVATSSSEVTSYGTKADIVDVGTLAQKPIEYRSGLTGVKPEYAVNLENSIHNVTYADITPLIDRLPVIRRFREASGIERTKITVNP